MKVLKNIFLVLTTATILFPTAVNLTHALSNHEHEVCTNYADEHFHSKSFDCELYKFQQNPALEISFVNFEPSLDVPSKITYPNHYYFLSDHQKLPFKLRGPPMD